MALLVVLFVYYYGYRWSHECYVRLIYCYLLREGRPKGVTVIVEALQKREKESFHLTNAYVWIQLVTLAMAREGIQVKHSSVIGGATPKTAIIVPSEEDLSTPKTTTSTSTDEASADSPSSAPPPPSFKEFSAKPSYGNLGLDNPQTCLEYYSESVLDSEEAHRVFLPPDRKPLPSMVASPTTSTTLRGLVSSFKSLFS